MGKLLKVALSLVPRTSSILKCHSIVSVGPCGPGSYITPITPPTIQVIFISKNGKEILKNHQFFSFFHFLKKNSSSCKKIPPKKNHA
jgi:hypothetical protein